MASTLSQIAAALGADLSRNGDSVIEQLAYDSRSLTNDRATLFFALHTESNDGHLFVKELYDRGVRNFVVEKIPSDMQPVPSDAAFLVVPDSKAALRQLGAVSRQSYRGQVAAITGSRGKTTLKEWIFQLMEPLAEISRSPRSYNSQIGVPLSLWGLGNGEGAAVIEAGVSAAGDMATLRDMIDPDTVILTNINDDHSEGFLSERNKAVEKASLAASPRCTTVIYNADSDLLRQGVASLPGGKTLLGWSRTDRSAPLWIDCTPEPSGMARGLFGWHGGEHSFEAPLRDDTDIENAANALAFMLSSGIEPATAAARLSLLSHLDTRLNVTEGVNDCSVVWDSYTSDFSSLAPALDFVLRRAMPGQRLTLILSDPQHEGSSDNMYADMAALIKRAGAHRLIGVGKGFVRHAALFGDTGQFFESTEQMLDELSTSDFDNEIILLKGAPDYGFGRVRQMLEARTHQTVLEVNLDAVVRNYNYFRHQVPASTGVVCMVKASGYGAGSREIAKTLQDAGASYLAVAVLDEGIDLRNNGITMPIMVMNPKVVNYRSMFAHRLEPEIYSPGMLRDVIREARKNGISGYPVHIKLDTGMHRMGFVEDELPALAETLRDCREVRVSSMFSHLATADEPSMDDYTEMQLDTFDRWTSFMLQRVPYRFKRHILNSAGILRFPRFHYDLVRLGIGLYGANTLPPTIEKPLAVVSTLRTVIIALRHWPAGSTVGYGRKGVLERDSVVATIPIGYADGMNRHFGRGAVTVRVNGQDAPTLGNICMDACMIDVTGIDCAVGDSVEIFGPDAPLQRLADTLDTIPYEVLTSVSPRVKRVYYRE